MSITLRTTWKYNTNIPIKTFGAKTRKFHTITMSIPSRRCHISLLYQKHCYCPSMISRHFSSTTQDISYLRHVNIEKYKYIDMFLEISLAPVGETLHGNQYIDLNISEYFSCSTKRLRYNSTRSFLRHFSNFISDRKTLGSAFVDNRYMYCEAIAFALVRLKYLITDKTKPSVDIKSNGSNYKLGEVKILTNAR